MGLTGLEIYKNLPKKNCGECGPPTCLAFAMNLAAGKASLDLCPYVSQEARDLLDSASQPPMALIEVGAGDRACKMGGETELFRHDKRFYQETVVAVRLEDTLAEEELAARAGEISRLSFSRVGLQYRVQLVAVSNASGDSAAFARAVEVVAASTDLPLLLQAEALEPMEAALARVGNQKPLLYGATRDNWEAMASLAKKYDCPLAVRGENLSQLAELVEQISRTGHKKLVLDSGAREDSRVLADLTQMRRLAVKEKFRPFGYPAMVWCTGEDSRQAMTQAAAYISRYAGLVVLDTMDRAQLLGLLTWRQNLYTDPQVPIQVEERLYPIGEANADSPVFITTNFSLTYFSVEGEVETSKVPSYILPIDTQGTSVLTAYASGKFEAEIIAKAMKKHGLEEKVKHRQVVIPGQVAVLAAKLKEESGWDVLVGPIEAASIPSFVKSHFPKGA